jgi:hypothetical protein
MKEVLILDANRRYRRRSWFACLRVDRIEIDVAEGEIIGRLIREAPSTLEGERLARLQWIFVEPSLMYRNVDDVTVLIFIAKPLEELGDAVPALEAISFPFIAGRRSEISPHC